MTTDSQREQALTVALSQIERQFGKGSVKKMSDQANEAIPFTSTMTMALWVALVNWNVTARRSAGKPAGPPSPTNLCCGCMWARQIK